MQSSWLPATPTHHGDEVADSESFPASLEGILQVPVANFGVGGYGPEQAVLKLEGLIDRFPRARVVVLAIMYENVRRMVNSYRPVYYGDPASNLGSNHTCLTESSMGSSASTHSVISRRC